MTRILTIDPGGNTGIALGYFDAITPYQLLERWQVHGGVEGFIQWWRGEGLKAHLTSEHIVVESFRLREENDFAADLTPVMIEGALKALLILDRSWHPPIVFQPPSDKGRLIGYSKEAQVMAGTRGKTRRQRERFDFLERFGLFKAGTENDDSNDAITHALVWLRKSKHAPTQNAFWPPRPRPEILLYNSDISPDLRLASAEYPGF